MSHVNIGRLIRAAVHSELYWRMTAQASAPYECVPWLNIDCANGGL